MPEVGVVPAPDSPYVELDATSQARRFAKHILTVGETFVHPATGKPLTVDESWWTDLKKNWDEKVVPICQFPAADEKNRHTENPLMNLGRVVDLRRQGQKIYADVEVPDPAVADKVGKTILGASAMLHMDYPDPRSGRRRGKALVHVAATNHPHLVSLEPYSELAASSTELHEVLPDGSVLAPRLLMLCADQSGYAPVQLAGPDEGDYQDDYQRLYGGTAGMDEDYLRDEIARLGLEAQLVSSGRGSRPEYGMIITDRDRQAALSAEREVTDEEIIGATRELAERHQVSFTAVSMMAHDGHIRAGLGHDVRSRARVLGEVAVALSRGRLEVDDEQIVSLSQARRDGEDEILRLTSDEASGDMFGLAHPAKSGRVTTKSRAHAPDEEDATTEDPDTAIERYLKMHAEEWGAEALHAGSHGTTSYAPKTGAQRERDEERERAGHQGDMRSISDYARGSARTRSGR